MRDSEIEEKGGEMVGKRRREKRKQVNISCVINWFNVVKWNKINLCQMRDI